MSDFFLLRSKHTSYRWRVRENREPTKNLGESVRLGSDQGGTITAESGNFRFNLGSIKDGIYHEIRSIGIESIISEFGKFGLEEIGKEFASSADESEK